MKHHSQDNAEEAEEGEQQEIPRLKQARRDDGIHEEL